MTVLTTAIPCSTYNWICRTPAVLEQVLQLSKWAKNSSRHSTGFTTHICLADLLQAFNSIGGSQIMYMTIFHRHSTGFCEGRAFLYRLPNTFSVIKMCLWTIQRVSRGFVVVKTGSPNNYRPSTSIGTVKTCFSNLYRPSTNFLAAKTLLPNFYRHSSSFAVVETDLLNLYIPLTENAVVKTYLLNFHRY